MYVDRVELNGQPYTKNHFVRCNHARDNPGFSHDKSAVRSKTRYTTYETLKTRLNCDPRKNSYFALSFYYSAHKVLKHF